MQYKGPACKWWMNLLRYDIMQFLTSAPNFRGSADSPDLAFTRSCYQRIFFWSQTLYVTLSLQQLDQSTSLYTSLTACLRVVKSVWRNTVWLSLNNGVSAVTCAFCRAGVTLAGQVDWTAVVWSDAVIRPTVSGSILLSGSIRGRLYCYVIQASRTAAIRHPPTVGLTRHLGDSLEVV